MSGPDDQSDALPKPCAGSGRWPRVLCAAAVLGTVAGLVWSFLAPAAPLAPVSVTPPGVASPTALLLAAAAIGAPPADADEVAGDKAGGGENPFKRRITAPELSGGVDWINTAEPLELKGLRGKFVLLDFWTYCCINCMHILPELKKLEAAFPNELVVIGVHSAKFENEEDSKNITEAVLRYEIKHPVVNDAHHKIWDRYSIRSWPTALLIDPEGKVVYGRSGEFKADEFAELLNKAIPYYRKKGTLDEKPIEFALAADSVADTPLRFPGKVLADEAGRRLFIADSNHNRIVIAGLDGALVDVIGSGAIGAADGDFQNASFNHPQGMALAGNILYVADTENHMLRKVDLAGKRVTTIAGDGHQAQGWPGIDMNDFAAGVGKLPERFVGKPRDTQLNSPWDLQIHGPNLFIAMAGPHQIWRMPLDESEIGPYAGNSREDIVDGPLLPSQPYEAGYASFAQPSGLAADDNWLYVADSEGSSIRAVPLDPSQPVRTIVGTADLSAGRLFIFGDHDGVGRAVRLQHPLGVAFYDGVLYVADTYNNKIKAIDPAKKTVYTIAGTGKPGHADSPAAFDEPAGLSGAAGKLYVADTNNHLIRTIDLADGNRVSTFDIRGLAPPKLAAEPASTANHGQQIRVAKTSLKPEDGLVWLAVKLTLPAGYKINPQAPMRYKITAADESGPLDRAYLGHTTKVDPPAAEFQIELPVAKEAARDNEKGDNEKGDNENSGNKNGGNENGHETSETIAVELDYYYCQEGPAGICKAARVTWTVPLSISGSLSIAGSADSTPLPATLPLQLQAE